MDIVIWTKSQVLSNQRSNEPVSFADIQMETHKNWILVNENDQKFQCTLNLKGTNPGKKVLKLLNELDGCKTLLNEIPFDDMLSEKKVVQLIRKLNWENPIMAAVVLVLQDVNIRQNLGKIEDEAEKAEIFIDKTIKMAVLMVLEIIYEIKDDQGRTYPDGEFMRDVETSQAAPVIQNVLNKQFEQTKKLRENYVEFLGQVAWHRDDLSKLVLTHPKIIGGKFLKNNLSLEKFRSLKKNENCKNFLIRIITKNKKSNYLLS